MRLPCSGRALRLAVALLVAAILTAAVACPAEPLEPTPDIRVTETARQAIPQATATPVRAVVTPTHTPVQAQTHTPTPPATAPTATATPAVAPTPPSAVPREPAATPQPTPAADVTPMVVCSNGVVIRDLYESLELVDDCVALLELREALLAGFEASRSAEVQLRWDADISIYEWEGVFVDGTPSRVQGLDLGEMGLMGEVPEALGRLTGLKELVLAGNQLTGCIPAELGMAEVEADLLHCDDPRFILLAELDSEMVAQCSNGIAVAEVWENTGLVRDCVTLLEAAEVMDGNGQLNWNADIPMRQWEGVFVEGSPARVVDLSLSGKGLKGEIPPELGRLSGLRGLVLQGNQLTGEIPPELGELVGLWGMFLDNNKLTGQIPPELGLISGLRVLHLSTNQLTGEIPRKLGQLTQLEHLGLSVNQLGGEIPRELGRLTELELLDLGGNRLTSEIPSELGNLAELEWLGLAVNQLTGEIPPEIGNLTKLDVLALAHNHLEGEIPPELKNLTVLRWLDVIDNRLTGEIPAELGSLNGLEWLGSARQPACGVYPRGIADHRSGCGTAVL